MVVKILGTGCKSCMKVYEAFKKAVGDNKEVEIIKVTDFKEIMKYKVMNMPAIVIDEKVIMQGKIPNEKQILEILNNNTVKTEVCDCIDGCDCKPKCDCGGNH